MRKNTYTLIKEACQLLLVIVTVAILTIGFYALSRILKPEAIEAIEDERQIEKMQEYHQTEEKTNLIYF